MVHRLHSYPTLHNYFLTNFGGSERKLAGMAIRALPDTVGPKVNSEVMSRANLGLVCSSPWPGRQCATPAAQGKG